MPCTDTDCDTSLSNNLEDNLQDVLPKIDVENPVTSLTSDLPTSHMTVVTAVSANHYLEAQAMIETLHKFVFTSFTNITFYLYDMGLTNDQLVQVGHSPQ